MTIADDLPLWCPDRHTEPMRVSCVQTGSYAGLVGSTVGQQPFAGDLTVAEEQPTFWGCTPHFGSLAVTMRGTVGPRSMIAFWLSGIEDAPERSGDLRGRDLRGRRGGRGGSGRAGRAPVPRPDQTEEFATEPLRLDVGEDHTYAVDWRPDSLVFSVDGLIVRELQQAPDYPVQLMLGVFEFPHRHPDRAAAEPRPELVISSVRVMPLP
ncbi:MAG TPA: glycoside hydrolase family 16 protein [Microlunatus sp.]|nr:glycoside hydrolase family 16 protein [Microlunatus sp.]